MTALQPARQEPAGDGPPGAADRTVRRIPFPVVDEITRHCLTDDEPETVHIEVHLPGRPDRGRLRAAFREALCRHPRILMRQAPHRWWRRRYAWELTGVPDVDPVVFPPPGPDALERARERALADCPPLDASPPVRLEVIEGEPRGGGDGTVLLVTINHTALDGPACLRVLATAAQLYGGADNSPAPPPVRAAGTAGGAAGGVPPDTPPLGGHRLERPVRIAADHGRHHDGRHGATGSGSGSGSGSGGNNTGNGMLIAELPVPARPPRAGGVAAFTVNDQLLVATCLMVGRWNHVHGQRSAPVVVTMPVDDRPRGTDMPIGNGTRLVSVGFGPAEERDAALLTADPPDPAAVARLLRSTAARTRSLKAAPGSQLGVGAALLTAPVLPVGVRGVLTRALRTAAAPLASTTLLSNIGRIPYPLDFGDAGRPTAVWFSAPARMPRGLTVTTVSVGGRVQLALRWSRALLDDEAGARLGALFARSLAATSWSPETGGDGAEGAAP
ncbi:condensation protein [Streptomyces sp. CB02923]|uniref:condensation protein n=1 Tax=Streptomyces sp. CB02923 TaxID=1718985 RepID=UPI0009396479|nr:condensation protein [Streptomyces sp. CB02923]OKI04866.1 condensation protein [Streptomyces sp. CB02923]